MWGSELKIVIRSTKKGYSFIYLFLDDPHNFIFPTLLKAASWKESGVERIGKDVQCHYQGPVFPVFLCIYMHYLTTLPHILVLLIKGVEADWKR